MEKSKDFGFLEVEESTKKFDIEKLLEKFKIPIFIFLFGLIVIGFGVLVLRGGLSQSSEVEVLSTSEESFEKEKFEEVFVEVSGAVVNPGVYKLAVESRIEDALVSAGGFSGDADRELIEKLINRAAKVADGQKIYVPHSNEQSTLTSASNLGGGSVLSNETNGLININSASLKELDSLPGIGQVYGQKIIDNRPYSDISELQSRGVLSESVYAKIKGMVSVF